jgi:hypothetical protein
VIAHIGALPLEETLASFGPALLVAVGALAARLRARLHKRAGARVVDELNRVR